MLMKTLATIIERNPGTLEDLELHEVTKDESEG